MKYKLGISGICVLLLAGCSMVPSKSEIDQLPVVTFGDAVPKSNEYILYFPANTPILTSIGIEGNLLKQPANDELSVKLAKDIYAYKDWVSFDKTHWVNAREVMEIRTVIKIPGPRHPEPGIIQVKVNEKQPKEN